MILNKESFFPYELEVAEKLDGFFLTQGFEEIQISISPQPREMLVKGINLIVKFWICKGGCEPQIHITNINIPTKRRRQGISKKFIGCMLEASKKNNMHLLLTGIINDDWYNALIVNGAKQVDLKSAGKDLYINPQDWKQ